MQGRILDFSISEGRGVITGDDGKRYSFLSQEWKEQQAPSKGQVVDYDVDANGAAIGVYAALSATGSSINVSDSLKNIYKNLDAKSKSDYSAIDWYLSAFKKYATFTGRAQRKEYWFYVLFYAAAIIVLLIIDSVLFGLDGMHLFSTLFMLASFVPSVAVSARRLHDIGKSGWWQLLALIPLVGTIILIIWFAKEGDAADNAYGPNPLL